MRKLSVRQSVLFCLLLLTVVSAGLTLLSARRQAGSYPPNTLPPVSFWYWHTPFVLLPAETNTLHRMGVRELFVRAATLTYSGDPNDPVRSTLRQKWSAPPAAKAGPVDIKTVTPVRIHLVFPVDGTLVRRFEGFPERTFARSLAKAIQTERLRAAAERGGIDTIVGVQIDLDCPTRLLPRYAAVLKELRPSLSATDALSITLLTSWYDSRAIGELLDQVDFSVPQFYEARTSTTRNQFHPVSDPARLLRGLHQAERLGKPFFVGLPIYGHALVYNGKGRLRGLFHDAAAADLIGRPETFRFLGAAPLDRQGQDARTPEAFIGEERVEFGAARPGTAFRLTYDLPTPELLRRHLALLRDERLPLTCRGILLYRFPEPGQEAVLPLATVAAVFHGQSPQPNLKIRFKTRRAAPFDLVEAPTGSPPRERIDLYLTVANDGTGPARVVPDAVTIDLSFKYALLEAVRVGEFARVEGFAGTPDKRASIARADGLRLFTTHLAPGERRVIGPITLLPTGGPAIATVETCWCVALPGGFDSLRGQIPQTALEATKEKETR